MKGTIEELWHGNIIPHEDSRTNSKEMKELLGYISRHQRTWRKASLTSRRKSSKSSMIVGANTRDSKRFSEQLEESEDIAEEIDTIEDEQ